MAVERFTVLNTRLSTNRLKEGKSFINILVSNRTTVSFLLLLIKLWIKGRKSFLHLVYKILSIDVNFETRSAVAVFFNQ